MIEGTKLSRFSYFQILTKITYSDFIAQIFKSTNFEAFSLFTAKLQKSIQMIKLNCKHDLQVFFLMTGTELSSFSHFQIFT